MAIQALYAEGATQLISDVKPGERFGRLMALRSVGHDRHGYALCRCRCSCGKRMTTRRSRLRSGATTSCGCLRTLDSAFRHLLATYIFAAARRDFPFTLTEQLFRRITSSDCFYCGAQPSNTVRRKKDVYKFNGIDRKNNSQGYTPSNSVACCWPCNQLKSSRNADAFLSHVLRIAKVHA